MTGVAPIDVLVVGDLNPDLVVTAHEAAALGGQVERDADVVMTLGGSGGICAAGLATLGLRTALCASVGADDMGHAAQRMLGSAGVRLDAVDVRPGRRTGISVHLLGADDRTIYTDRGAMADLQIADALRWVALLRPRHVHLCSLYLIPELSAGGGRLVDAARAGGATTSLDTNFDPAGLFEVPQWLTEVDYLLPNDTEALWLTGRPAGDDVRAAAHQLAAGGALVAIKCGARGAIAVHGPHYAEARPARAEDIVDAVGAGDSFDAGLIRAMLDGRELADALALACACGALSTRAVGGTIAQPALAEAQEFATSIAVGANDR